MKVNKRNSAFKLKSLRRAAFAADRLGEEVKSCQSKYDQFKAEAHTCFDEYPLSKKTRDGLTNAGYLLPTDIQRMAILVALRGKDLLAAAKTGSGKTLAFAIPVIEHLWKNQWTAGFGLAVMIVAPTRELAMQTYETIQKIGRHHDFAMALIIGGTDVSKEKQLVSRSNLIVCTPGRLLQHMDENPSFDSTHLELLVIDETDRILDMGFKSQLDAILANLPSSRQTLLFSATQTKSIQDLARLSLDNPVFVSAHEYCQFATPDQLVQKYSVVVDQDKMNFLWSFLRSHLKVKSLVFFNTCKQVRFVYSAFRKLRPGLTILRLYGKMKLAERHEVYNEFKRKRNVALFATDVASRGLDFPDVGWVIHMDCPADVNDYIHRSGRTARHESKGQALLVVAPHQTVLVKELVEAKVPIEEIRFNPDKLFTVDNKLARFCTEDSQLKDYAQKAIVAYVKSVHHMRNKEIFSVDQLDLNAIAKSMGLSSAPRVRFLEKHKKLQGGHSPPAAQSQLTAETPDDQDDLLFVKASGAFNVEESVSSEFKELVNQEWTRSKRLKLAQCVNKKIVFANSDDEGQEQANCTGSKVTDEEGDKEEEDRHDIEKARQRLQEADKVDAPLYRDKMRAKRKLLRMKRKLREAEATGKQLPKALLSRLGMLEADEGGAEAVDRSEPDLSWLPDPDKVPEEEEKKKKKKKSGEYQPPGPKIIKKMTLSEKEELARKLLNI